MDRLQSGNGNGRESKPTWRVIVFPDASDPRDPPHYFVFAKGTYEECLAQEEIAMLLYPDGVIVVTDRDPHGEWTNEASFVAARDYEAMDRDMAIMPSGHTAMPPRLTKSAFEKHFPGAQQAASDGQMVERYRWKGRGVLVDKWGPPDEVRIVFWDPYKTDHVEATAVLAYDKRSPLGDIVTIRLYVGSKKLVQEWLDTFPKWDPIAEHAVPPVLLPRGVVIDPLRIAIMSAKNAVEMEKQGGFNTVVVDAQIDEAWKLLANAPVTHATRAKTINEYLDVMKEMIRLRMHLPPGPGRFAHVARHFAIGKALAKARNLTP
jgi:hypothetical protein